MYSTSCTFFFFSFFFNTFLYSEGDESPSRASVILMMLYNLFWLYNDPNLHATGQQMQAILTSSCLLALHWLELLSSGTNLLSCRSCKIFKSSISMSASSSLLNWAVELEASSTHWSHSPQSAGRLRCSKALDEAELLILQEFWVTRGLKFYSTSRQAMKNG